MRNRSEKFENDGFIGCDIAFATLLMAGLFGVHSDVAGVHIHWDLFRIYAESRINRVGIFGGRAEYDGFSDSSVSDCEVNRSAMKSTLHFNVCFSSFISGITLLGLPTEIYSYGIQYLYVIGGVILMGIIMGTVYLPVFHKLNITSTYEVLPNQFFFSDLPAG